MRAILNNYRRLEFMCLIPAVFVRGGVSKLVGNGIYIGGTYEVYGKTRKHKSQKLY